MRCWDKIAQKIKEAPKTPGVYVFYEKRRPLYVGKAANLRNRLQSYLKTDDFKSERLQKNATELKFLPLRSEIEALLQEAKLIKKLNPAYNILWRDDKSYFYAAITKEKFPRIFITHQKSLEIGNWKLEISRIGPFTEGRALKIVLKTLRRSFPYCTCKKQHLRICLNAQLGNCPGFCCQRSYNPTKQQTSLYQKNIRVIKNFLLGKLLKSIQKNLKVEEKTALKKILAHREFLEDLNSFSYSATRKPSCLIEGYDISHLAGRETVGAMTAWFFSRRQLKPRKNFWRKFIIKTEKPNDDLAALKEMLQRRLNHPEWPYPGLIIIDGGITQLKAGQKIALQKKIKSKIISFAKPQELIYGLTENPQQLNSAPAELRAIVPRIIAETHRFAISFHRQRRIKSFLTI